MLRRRVQAIKLRMLYFYGFFFITAASWAMQARDLHYSARTMSADAVWVFPYLLIAVTSLGAAFFWESTWMRRIALVTFPAVFMARALVLAYQLVGDHAPFGVSRAIFFVWLATAFTVIMKTLWSLPQEVYDYLDLRGQIDATIDEVVRLRAIVAGEEST